MKIKAIIFAGLFYSFNSTAHAGIGSVLISDVTCNSMKIAISLGNAYKEAPTDGSSTYYVNLITGATTQETGWVVSDNSVINLPNLLPFTPYHFVVTARTRRRTHPNEPGIYRIVDEKTQVTLQTCNPPTTNYNNPQPGDVRLRHEVTGMCIFGNSADGGPVGAWGCWGDPNMAVSLESLGGADVRIRMRGNGKCLFGNPVGGKEVKNFQCWSDPNMVYERQDLGNNRVRLRHKATGQCMYTGSIRGNFVKNWPCWNDPAMVWVIESF